MSSRSFTHSFTHAVTACAASISLATTALPHLAQAQTPFPTKPIRLVLPSAAGGNADIVTRIAAEAMTRELGHPVYVENMVGGRQIPGTLLVARANPDGYTLLGTGPSFTTNAALYNDLPYDTVKDFAPVGVFGATPQLIIAAPGFAASNIKELIALAKTKPDSIHYTSTGVGSTAHLGGELLNSMAGIRLVHVPYKATAQANNDVMSGVVELSMPAAASVVSLVKAGKMKALGIASTKRSPQMPDVATIAETLPGYEIYLWNGVAAPAATPKPVIARLNTALNKGISSPDMKDKFFKAGVEINPQTPEQMAAYIDKEVKNWIKVVKEAGIQGER